MKNKILFMTLVVAGLLVANIILFFGQSDSQHLNYDPYLFTVKDTSQIVEVQFKDTNRVITLTKKKYWTLNNQSEVDPYLIKIFFSILNNIKISKPISENTNQKLLQRLRNESQEVKISLADGNDLTYNMLPNSTFTKTYFFDENQKGYQIEIPGYSDFVGTWFSLHSDQWLNRLIFSGNWRTIQKLSVNFINNSKENYSITFKDNFFEIENLTILDSALVIDYFERFNYLQANEIITNGRFPQYDSLAQTTPEITLNIEDIHFKEQIVLNIYPKIQNEHIRLVSLGEKKALFEEKRIYPIIKYKSYFFKKKSKK